MFLKPADFLLVSQKEHARAMEHPPSNATGFKSYLSFRTQSVCINNEISNSGCLTVGVPQGSILDQLLFFLIYINYMKRCCELLTSVQYAYGTTFHISGDNLNIICNTMNVQLEKFYLCLKLNKLSPDIDTTHYMNFTGSPRNLPSINFRNSSLLKVTELKFLGVIIDNTGLRKKSQE